MKKPNLGKFRHLILFLALLIFAGEIGYVLGKREVSLAWQNWQPKLSVINREPPPEKDLDFNLFWDVWERLSKDHLNKGEIDPQEMIYGAISGMTQSLGDPYTVFLPPEENKTFKDDLSGEKFEGIGAQLGLKEERIVIVAPLKGSPAEEAGIKAGDLILKVNEEETLGWTLPEAVTKIRGEKGTKVVLTVARGKEKEQLPITITRGTIVVKSVEWEEKKAASCEKNDDQCVKVVYLKLSRFGNGVEDWEKAVSEITSRRAEFKGLIFDLRNNPGGYLSGAVYIASEFLKDGTVVQQESGSGGKRTYAVERTGKLTEIPMIILVNKGSASASEIVAIALKEKDRAQLLGEKTFGKGTIQEAQELESGAGLHVTTAKWLSPSGASVEDGLEPDIVVEDNEEDDTKDPQLEKAIDLLIAQ